MFWLHCPGCSQSFPVEDSRIARLNMLCCPNCDMRVPPLVVNASAVIANLPQEYDAHGWEVTHLADSRFTSAVAVKTL